MKSDRRCEAMGTERREICLNNFDDMTRSTEFARLLGPLNCLWYVQLAALIKYHAPDANRVLDLGTGPGHLIELLYRRYPQAHIVGIDQALPMLNIARRLRRSPEAAARTSLVHGNFHALPFRNHTFDLVTATGILHHVDTLRLFFSEIYRVLAPAGRLIVSAFRRDVSPGMRAFSRCHSNWLTLTGSRLEGLYYVLAASWTKQEVEEAFAQTGFRNVTVRARRLRLQVIASA
jgi:ubiquinone/menaquinone biosynthesis C-methylase UbiE